METTVTKLPSILARLIVLAAVMTVNQQALAQCSCQSSSANGMLPWGSEVASMGALQIFEEDAIYLTVNVPEDTAPLTINGDPTISLGKTRYFVIRHLEPGRTYQFEIMAERANAAGVAMEEIKVIKVAAGSNRMLELNPIKRKGDPDARTVEGEEDDEGTTDLQPPIFEDASTAARPSSPKLLQKSSRLGSA